MAVTAETVQILVTAEVDKALKDLKKTENETKKTTNSFKDFAKVVAGPAVAGAFIAALTKMGKAAEQAFQVQEKAVLGVNAALKSTGQFSEKASQDIQDYASELQEVTTIGDETTLSLIQTALNMGLTADEAKNAAKQAIGMSEAFGVGLDTALRGVANSTLGNFDALTRYLPALKTATTEAEKSAIVQKQLGDAFAIAESNALSASGVQTQLNNNIGDLQETIGGLISESLTPWRAELSGTVVDINKLIQAQILQRKVSEGEASTVEELINANNELTATQRELERRKDTLAIRIENLNNKTDAQIARERTTREVLQKRIDTETAAIATTERRVGSIANGIMALESQIEEERLAAQAIIDKATAVETETEAVTANNEAQQESLEIAQSRIESDAVLLAQLERINAAQAQYNSELDDYNAKLEATKITAEELGTNVLTGLASGFEALGQSLIEGGLEFKDFGKIALNVLADVLSSVGAQLAARAALLFFPLIGPPRPGAAGALAGSVAAFAAAGVARGAAGALAEGGSFTTNGPQTLLVGDNPGGQEEVTVNPVSSSGANQRNGGGMTGPITLIVDGQQMTAHIQDQIDNRNIRGGRGGAL